MLYGDIILAILAYMVRIRMTINLRKLFYFLVEYHIFYIFATSLQKKIWKDASTRLVPIPPNWNIR